VCAPVVGGRQGESTAHPGRRLVSRPDPRERALADEFDKGDHVTWNSHGGTAEGTVEREITEDTEASGRTVRASPDDPQYEVRSEKSGGTAVHKPSALHED
jgi:Hypervirulence associated proteins TUDOR domain